MRRFTRLCSCAPVLGFSKKLANLTYAVALYFAHYNFCRVHKTLETTPAVAAAITERPWTLEEMLRGEGNA